MEGKQCRWHVRKFRIYGRNGRLSLYLGLEGCLGLYRLLLDSVIDIIGWRVTLGCGASLGTLLWRPKNSLCFCGQAGEREGVTRQSSARTWWQRQGREGLELGRPKFRQ